MKIMFNSIIGAIAKLWRKHHQKNDGGREFLRKNVAESLKIWNQAGRDVPAMMKELEASLRPFGRN